MVLWQHDDCENASDDGVIVVIAVDMLSLIVIIEVLDMIACCTPTNKD